MDPDEQEREAAELARIIEPMLRDFVRCLPEGISFPVPVPITAEWIRSVAERLFAGVWLRDGELH
jgi:hypothetical protein